jgi:hypothetical protein
MAGVIVSSTAWGAGMIRELLLKELSAGDRAAHP